MIDFVEETILDRIVENTDSRVPDIYRALQRLLCYFKVSTHFSVVLAGFLASSLDLI
jgi:hypothetical protein